MRQLLYSLLLIAGLLLAFLGYGAALIDWLQDYSTGYYAFHRVEQGLETAAILLYTYLGVRFYQKRMGFWP